MTSRVAPPSLADILATMATLTSAQHALLERIAEHDAPATVAELAAEADLHVSSVRETLEALCEMGLVTREQLPSQGRGRPALGYSTTTPADPAFPALMLTQMTAAVLDWLRVGLDEPTLSAREIGRNWADRALREMGVPDHTHGVRVPEGFILADHMGKIRMFLSALGFAAHPSKRRPCALVLTACPFTDPASPDPLALEVRRGLVERALERTASGLATWTYSPDPTDPIRAEVALEAITPTEGTPLMTTIRFYGGAAEAAGTDSLEINAAATPATLGELLDGLSASRPALAGVLDVSSFLVDQRPADRSWALAPGSRVDVLPPFAGG
ncbi:MoaD/ThiS family protein [Schaalia hyovaginalis]|uniref:ArsR family transcriptional regulator/molybdopterin converting factor small subunit n=1 Tax=Schaalia hyovaginalis TaxID=29316 RepID=A0A923IXY9_9ACTO|nr:MoaD/ThiS family protein [Schaalia hyovaginalis]MBB6333816.1 putative ArsR family transcriptional regulator/molybdopterin converting factor small subunit [Schaalia hyovaginalis]MDY2668933.1 MoaD/ThiS family protein [Schaalia hyovaginalis]